MILPYEGASALLHRLPLPSTKLSRSLGGRRGSAARWVAWANRYRRDHALIWVHAASVGEALAADPIIRRLRARHRDAQVILTHTSPSVTTWSSRLPVHRVDFSPEETANGLTGVFDALRPSLLVFSRGDLWPGLVRQATARSIPVALIGAVLHRSSRRMRWPARSVLGRHYARLAYAGAVGPTDAENLRRLGVPPGTIETTGDPRDDQILERSVDLGRLAPLSAWAAHRRVLVAGSAEPSDRRPLAEAVHTVRQRCAEAGLLIVPHDPDAWPGDSPDTWAEWAPGAGTRVPDSNVLVVRATGLLADAYLLGEIAYVGGGGGAGLHSLAEPAAFGLPIMAATRRAGFEAQRFLAGGVVPLTADGTGGSLTASWQRLLDDASLRRRMGLAARGCVRAGASRRSATALERLLSG